MATQGPQAGIVAEERVQKLASRLVWQRIQAKLTIKGLASPAVLVLRPIVDQKQNTGRRETVDEAVKKCLGLGVDPVQVLEDEQQRPHLALVQEQPF